MLFRTMAVNYSAYNSETCVRHMCAVCIECGIILKSTIYAFGILSFGPTSKTRLLRLAFGEKSTSAASLGDNRFIDGDNMEILCVCHASVIKFACRLRNARKCGACTLNRWLIHVFFFWNTNILSDGT